MELLLGIDIGTSACKIAIFQKDGIIVASGTADYPVYYPKQGWAEQNPDDWWDAVCKTIKTLLKKYEIQPSDIAGIGIDGQSWSAIAIDKQGEVLTNTPIWLDTRSSNVCEKLKKQFGEDIFFQMSGNPLQPFYATGKILWYKEEMPDVYKSIDKILQSNTFIAYRLTGGITQDISQSYGIHCFDIREGIWDEEMCRTLGIPRNFLPEIVPCHQIVGHVTKEAAKLTGLNAGTPVVAGGLDAACGTLGAGVLHTGETQEQGGQAGGMSICMDAYTADPRLILSYHVVPGKWLLQGGTTGGGGVMRWFNREFADTSSLMQLNEIAGKVPEGSDGLVFLPYMAGERCPVWDKNAKGVYYGIDFSKTKGHFVRAAMEGVAYSLKHNLDVAESKGVEVGELRSMGGSANSLLWTQMKADITGKRIVVPSSDTATTLGAVILAGVGVGIYDSFEQAVRMTVKTTRSHEPDMEKHEKYKVNYSTYLELYESLKDLMKKTGGDKK